MFILNSFVGSFKSRDVNSFGGNLIHSYIYTCCEFVWAGHHRLRSEREHLFPEAYTKMKMKIRSNQ